MADRTLNYLATAFTWQQSRDDNFTSPIVRGMNRTTQKELTRDRVLDDDEIRAIWKATGEATMYSALVRFLLLTAARRNEAARMPRQEIKGSDWTLPAARNKVKQDLVRPLSKAARDVLATLPQQGDYVFGGRGGVAFTDFGNGKKWLDQASGVRDWRIHDLRRTASTLMSRAGVNPDHKERCLGHVIGGVRGVYDKWQFRDEKAEAYERLAKLVGEIVR
jgi:integrase